ncbi:MAG: dihydroorotase [Bryobacterales bacterium]|nr:dihydroorotase [Bryobacterales bacterium]
MSSLLIKNGRVLDPASGRDGIADVLIVDGRVAAVGANLEKPTGLNSPLTVQDATGHIVAPGFIDMHVHLREPGQEHAETIESGGRAAAAGGFTSVCCMPNTVPVNDNATVTSYIIERARHRSPVRVFPIGAITKGSAGEELASIGAMKQAGIVAISDDGRPVMNSRVMRRAMELAAGWNLPVIDHCEDLNLSAGGDMHEGLTSVRRGLRGIPSASEDVMVARDILLAEVTGARYHVAHISTTNAVRMVAYARAQGLKVSCEVTPHHFALADEDAEPYDSNYKMRPPLRGRRDLHTVMDGLVDGTIEVIATDHAPHAGSEKMQEFERCPFGITGLETAIGLSMDLLVHPGRIDLMKLVALYTTGPARVLGLEHGRLAPGAPGDVTIFNPDIEWTYDVNRTLSKSKNSPFHERQFRGGPIATIVGGAVVWSRA